VITIANDYSDKLVEKVFTSCRFKVVRPRGFLSRRWNPAASGRTIKLVPNSIEIPKHKKQKTNNTQISKPNNKLFEN